MGGRKEVALPPRAQQGPEAAAEGEVEGEKGLPPFQTPSQRRGRVCSGA